MIKLASVIRLIMVSILLVLHYVIVILTIGY